MTTWSTPVGRTGCGSARQAISRYKASIIFADLPKTLLARIPNATFALGAFGDILKRNRDELYLSWYPACKLGETTELDTRAMISRAKSTRPDRWLIDETIKGLSGFAPAVAELAQFADRARVGGGAIVAWGRTDITDPGSGLHARGGIGVTRTGGWISINTGKLTTAPLFARQAAAMILEPLSA